MKLVRKLPLYLGLSVFVFSVLISAITIGERKNIGSQRTKAGSSGANLSMKFAAPDLINVMLVSDKEVAGVDVSVRFDSGKMSILPSSLTGGSLFTTSGGIVDDEKETFSFSALAKKDGVTSGLVASFKVRARKGSDPINSTLQFVNGETDTSVIEKSSGQNILSTTSDIQFLLTSQKD